MEDSEKIIGKGRSGKVYRKNIDGNDLAVKVFSGVDDLTNLVNYVLTGAPNPYSWNADAVRVAHLRREVLTVLLKYWFGSKVRIAKSFGDGWNEKEKAFKISTEFISGRPVSLHHPFSNKTDWELADIREKVMKPLQKRLIESGFDGLVWQAGKGNPIALNNFLLSKDGEWVWIDAESGVPALFPLNPFSLFGFYLPKSVKYRRAMFDDVDVAKLRHYIKANESDLDAIFNGEILSNLWSLVNELDGAQQKWKSVSRIDKSISYSLTKELITPEQAGWFSKNKLAWIAREFVRFLKRALVKVFYKFPAKIWQKLISVRYLKIIKNSFRFIFNGDYRKRSVDELLKERITEWENRGQLKKKSAAFLRDQADHELTSPYLADFIILIGLKPLTNLIELFVLPAMYAAGLIGEGALVIGVAFGGIIYRTLYTLGRMIYERVAFVAEKRHSRWIALIVGMVPTLGNLAYPTQMVYAASSKSKELAEFLMYDLSARVGGKIPIWGGKDTLTEHFFNHIPDVIIRNRKALKKRKLMRIRKKQAQLI